MPVFRLFKTFLKSAKNNWKATFLSFGVKPNKASSYASLKNFSPKKNIEKSLEYP